MTAKARIRSADMARMAKIAKEFGVVVEQVVDGVITRVSPHDADRFPTTQTASELPHDRGNIPLISLTSDLHRREIEALKRLAEAGVGVAVYSCTLGQFGPHTQAKLVAKGHVEVINEKDGLFKDDQVSLTKRGLRESKSLIGGLRKTEIDL